MVNNSFWDDLQIRYDYLQNILRQNNIVPLNNHGLDYMLQETKACLDKVKIDVDDDDKELHKKILQSIKGLQALIALTTCLQTLDRKNISYVSQLRNCRAGNIEYGQPDENNRQIYFKDFEYEIFLAAMIAEKTSYDVFLPQDQSEFDIVINSKVAIQIKHPKNIDNTLRYLADFNRNLNEKNYYGIFAIGAEDAFNFGEKIDFADENEFQKYYYGIASQIDDVFGYKFISNLRKFERIIGSISTCTMYVAINGAIGGMNLRRFANSFIIENRNNFTEYNVIEKILKIFNPNPHKINYDENIIYR